MLNHIRNISLRKQYHTQKNIMTQIWYYRETYIMLLPAILFYIVFCYIPMYGITIAFKDFCYTKGILGSPWIGFEHFVDIFSDAKFWEVFRNTLEINIMRLFFGFPAPIILALLLNELSMKFYKRVVQTILYLPHFISWVVIAGIIFALLSNNGLANAIIIALGGEKKAFLTDSSLFRPLLVLSGIWKEAGWGTIIYLASLAAIPTEQYESAIIDGANRWQRAIFITLPGIAPTISVLLILNLGYLTVGGFDQVFNLYNPMVWDVGDILDTYIYRVGLLDGKFSMATAVGLFLNIINLILLLSANKISKRISGNGLY